MEQHNGKCRAYENSCKADARFAAGFPDYIVVAKFNEFSSKASFILFKMLYEGKSGSPKYVKSFIKFIKFVLFFHHDIFVTYL